MTDTIYTPKEVAEIFGCNTSTVWRHATRYNLGTQLSSGMRVYSESDIKFMGKTIQGKPGNPRMGSGQPRHYSKR